MTEIPKSHPRYASLVARERVAEGVKRGFTSSQGLIAQGRGECFDYLLGEKTTASAAEAIVAAAALLLLARRPALSVNGNVAALVPEEMCQLAQVLGAPLEVNLFHRTEDRVRKIAALLRSNGARSVLGENPDSTIPGLDHARALATRGGIYDADVVLIPLEDGDRCEALAAMGKRVIAIDLNPLSRTARRAMISIVDNILRAVPNLTSEVLRLSGAQKADLEKVVSEYDHQGTLRQAMQEIKDNLEKQKEAVEQNAEEERRQLEEHYEEARKIAEEGILDIIATLAATSPEWEQTGKELIDALIAGLESGDFTAIEQKIASATTTAQSGGNISPVVGSGPTGAENPLWTIGPGQYQMIGNKAAMWARDESPHGEQ